MRRRKQKLAVETALADTKAELDYCHTEMKNTWQANQTLIKEREYYRSIAEARKGEELY